MKIQTSTQEKEQEIIKPEVDCFDQSQNLAPYLVSRMSHLF